MQIESLKVFCDLVDTGSFTRSAAINGVTQSAVSQQVASLERNFKSVLLERKRGIIQLTPKGKTLYDQSQKLLLAYGNLLQEMDCVPTNGKLVSTSVGTVRKNVDHSIFVIG